MPIRINCGEPQINMPWLACGSRRIHYELAGLEDGLVLSQSGEGGASVTQRDQLARFPERLVSQGGRADGRSAGF